MGVLCGSFRVANSPLPAFGIVESPTRKISLHVFGTFDKSKSSSFTSGTTGCSVGLSWPFEISWDVDVNDDPGAVAAAAVGTGSFDVAVVVAVVVRESVSMESLTLSMVVADCCNNPSTGAFVVVAVHAIIPS